MDVWEAALWGAIGSLAIEIVELTTAMRRCNGWPWKQKGEPSLGPYLASVLLRVLLGAGLAGAMGKSDDICAPIAAFVTGLAAPVIVAEKLGSAAKSVAGQDANKPQAGAQR